MPSHTNSRALSQMPRPKSRKRLWVGRVAKMAVLASLVGTAANWRNIHMVATYNPIIFAPQYDEPANLIASRLQDIDYLSRLTRYDRSYNEMEREAFSAHLKEMARRAETMSPAAYYLAVSQAVAIADNGHTNIDIDPLYNEFPSIDVRFSWFADGLYIVEATGAAADMVGQRVTHIDRRPIEAVVGGLMPYRGGNAVWRKTATSSLMIAPSILFEAGLAEQSDRITLRIENTDGQTSDRVLSAIRTADDASTDEWTQVKIPKPDERPLSLADGRTAVQGALPNGGHYIRTPTGFGSSDMPLKTFYAATLDAIEPRSLDFLVVDFRRNSGGDYGNATSFAQRVHETVSEDGTLYLVTGPKTFSAAIVTIAMIKHYSERNVVIIGTPMGDREQFWAERGMDFRLPNSGWRIFYATGYHDWAGDCSTERHCFTRNRRYDDIAVGSLAPDVTVGDSFSDYVSGRDAVLASILDAHEPDRHTLSE